MKRNLWQSSLAALGLLVMILDGASALEGAREGLNLCIRTVIPSLFPFFVLSMVLTRSLTGEPSQAVRFLSGLLSIPEGAAAVIIPAFLGGYPVGAKCVSDLYRSGSITRAEAERLLAFCSNAGPSFLFGMVAGFFPERNQVWLLWFVQIAAAVCTAQFIPAPQALNVQKRQAVLKQEKDLLSSAAGAMTLVCCWVILFRILITFLDRWFLWLLPDWAQVAAMGFLELTNGCCGLDLIPDGNLRFILCSCMLSWGGICVLLQTVSVIGNLSVKSYLTGKLLQTSFCFLFGCLIAYTSGWLPVCILPILIIIFRKTANRYRNPRAVPV